MLLVAQVLSLGFNFATGIILARLLLPEGRGIYAVVTLIPFTLVALGNGGLNMANTYYALKETYDRKNLLGNSLVFSAVSGLVWIGLFLILEGSISQWNPSLNHSNMWFAVLSIPFLLFRSFGDALLLGLKQFGKRNWILLFESILMSFLLLGLYLFQLFDLHTVLICFFIQSALTAVLTFWLCLAHIEYRISFDYKTLMQMLSKGIKGAASPASTFLLLRSDIFLIGLLLDSTQVGIYAIAASLANMLSMAPRSIATAFLPRITQTNDSDKNRATLIVCRMTFALTLITCVIVGVFAESIITLFFGMEYVSSVPSFLLLLPAIAFVSVALILGSHLQGKGKFHHNAIASTLGLVVNVGSNLVLIPWLGVTGAAIGSIIGYTGTLIIMILYFQSGSPFALRDMFIPRREDFAPILQRFR